MKTWLLFFGILLLTTSATEAKGPLTARQNPVDLGLQVLVWEFDTTYDKDSTGKVQLVLDRPGRSPQVLSSLQLRPYLSSKAGTLVLKVLIVRADNEGKQTPVTVMTLGARSEAKVLSAIGSALSDGLINLTATEDASGRMILIKYGQSPIGSQGSLYVECLP